MASTTDIVSVEQTETAVHGIVTSLSDQIGVDVLDLPPLGETVDTDALTAVLQSESVDKIEFTYAGHRVAVDGDGRVRVTDEA